MKLLTFFLLAVVVAKDVAFALPERNLGLRKISGPAKRNRVKPEVKKIPYQVGILVKESDSESSWCGGSVIDNEWILTAAHCTEDIEEVTVYLGSKRLQSEAVSYKVNKTNIINHPGWNSDDIVNDISLIRIPFTKYSKKIQPVKLPEGSSDTYINKDVITSGWGHVTDTSVGLKKNLEWSIMHVITNDLCHDYFGTVITDTNVCVRSYNILSICRGDAGGPLVLDSTNIQIGVSSFGSRRGCEEGTPIVFTKVAPYLDWINMHIKKVKQ